eukprot:5970735-Prymnesium_polylepis.3
MARSRAERGGAAAVGATGWARPLGPEVGSMLKERDVEWRDAAHELRASRHVGARFGNCHCTRFLGEAAAVKGQSRRDVRRADCRANLWLVDAQVQLLRGGSYEGCEEGPRRLHGQRCRRARHGASFCLRGAPRGCAWALRVTQGRHDIKVAVQRGQQAGEVGLADERRVAVGLRVCDELPADLARNERVGSAKEQRATLQVGCSLRPHHKRRPRRLCVPCLVGQIAIRLLCASSG